jgi:hypothetical protein
MQEGKVKKIYRGVNFAWYWKKQKGGIVRVGRAHEGMAIAAENILDLVREQLHQAVR